MDKVQSLLKKLNYTISPELKKMVDGYNRINDKFVKAEEIFEAEPTDENKEAFEEIKEYFEDFEADLIVELQEAVAELENSNTPAPAPAPVVEDKKESSGLGIALVVGIGLLVISGGLVNILRK